MESLPLNAPLRPSRLIPLLLAAPALALLLVGLAGPLLFLLRVSLYEPAHGRGFYLPGTWTLHNYGELLGDYDFRNILGFTTVFGLGVTVLTLLLAYPLALFIDGLPPRRKALALAAVLLPKLASVLAVVNGLQILLSNSGPVNGRAAGTACGGRAGDALSKSAGSGGRRGLPGAALRSSDPGWGAGPNRSDAEGGSARPGSDALAGLPDSDLALVAARVGGRRGVDADLGRWERSSALRCSAARRKPRWPWRSSGRRWN